MAMKKKGDASDKLRKQLDEALPMGSQAALHRDAQAIEGLFSRKADMQNPLGSSPVSGNTSTTSAQFVGRTPMLYVDPMFDPILFLFPKDRIDEINKRLRHYYETDPIVGSAIDMHTAFPLSDYYLECENPDNQRYWNDHKERTGQVEFLRQLTHDHWLVGEGIGLPIWDEYNMEFSHYNQYPPENVDIIQSYVTPRKYFMLKPDPKLAEKVQSKSKLDEALMKMMDPAYVQSLTEGKAYLLGSDEKVMYLARNTTKYRARGVSILGRALKDLLYKDKLRLLQLTFVDRHMFPIKIFKLGSEAKGWIPNKKHFQRLDALLKQAANDPDFNILYHFGLTVDYVGTKDRIANLIPEFQWVETQIMAALFVNDEIIKGGLPSAVRDTVNMRTLMHRYMDLREKIERMMITHIFLPTARARGFYRNSRKADFVKQEEMLKRIAGKDVPIVGEFIDKEKKLFRIANSHCGAIDLSVYDIPRPIWKKLNLVNNTAEQQLMLALEGEGKVPLEMLLDMLGLDPRVVKSKMETQESTPFDPLWRLNRENVGQDKNIRLQVLNGKKHNEWSMAEGQELEAPQPGAPKQKKPAPQIGGGAPATPPAPGKEKGKPEGAPGAGAPPPPPPPPPKPPVVTKPPVGGTALPAMPAPGPVPGGAGEKA
jgi:hypothetical protein